MFITSKRRYTRTVTPAPTDGNVFIAITIGGSLRGGLVTGSAFDAFSGSPFNPNVAGYGGTNFVIADHQNFTYAYTTAEEITCLYALNTGATFASWSLQTGMSFKSGYSSTSNPTIVVMNTSGSKQIGCRFN